jgi:hypothetical protein
LPHGVADWSAGFQHDRLKAALQHMGGGGKADRPGSDDRDGLGSLMLFSHKTRNIEISRKTRRYAAARLGIRGFGAFRAAFRDQKPTSSRITS